MRLGYHPHGMPLTATRPSCRILRLAIFATLVHALMPLLMAAPVPGGMMMKLCSVQGSRTVFVQLGGIDDTEPRESPLQELRPLCPLCLAGAHLALTPPANPAPLLLAGLQHVAPSGEARRTFLPRPASAFQPRAPPLPV
ncbi:DUF2946 family protein [Uliginosibacterium paludis]|uniref:DUF2946 family protein n=1 Tax=Uliginosibacterium paludis TaxID=1615952 RepID=A0ABV2CPR3_9RHOO